jgi:endonuclease-8
VVVPEGDTIHRTASVLRTALVGRPTVRFDAPRLQPPYPGLGRVVESVESHGKHLEIMWDDGIVLHTHLRMTGSWHVYRPGERWRRPDHQARVVIEVPDWLAVCFNAPTVETYRTPDRRRHPGFGRLGPDLCRPDADLAEAVSRMAHYPDPDAIVADVLLDQRVMAGVGNVFRSEVLWACELSPFALVGDLDHRDHIELVRTAAKQLRANLEGPGRITAPSVPGGLAVYGRNGQRCPRCAGIVTVTRAGQHRRLVYWCPDCQTRLDARPLPEPTADDDTPTDRHPAAVLFLAQVREARARREADGRVIRRHG